MGENQSLGGLSSERGQALHQAAFAAGSVVLVNHALFSSLVQGADRGQCGLPGLLRVAGGDGLAGLLDKGARPASVVAVAQAPLLVLPVAFNLRLDICQLAPPKTKPQEYGWLFYLRPGNLSSKSIRDFLSEVQIVVGARRGLSQMLHQILKMSGNLIAENFARFHVFEPGNISEVHSDFQQYMVQRIILVCKDRCERRKR